MDLAYLYHRRGMSLARSISAACPASRAAHLGLLRGYEARIASRRLLTRRPRQEQMA